VAESLTRKRRQEEVDAFAMLGEISRTNSRAAELWHEIHNRVFAARRGWEAEAIDPITLSVAHQLLRPEMIEQALLLTVMEMCAGPWSFSFPPRTTAGELLIPYVEDVDVLARLRPMVVNELVNGGLIATRIDPVKGRAVRVAQKFWKTATFDFDFDRSSAGVSGQIVAIGITVEAATELAALAKAKASRATQKKWFEEYTRQLGSYQASRAQLEAAASKELGSYDRAYLRKLRKDRGDSKPGRRKVANQTGA
jgi:hypothetical protein